MTQQLPANSDQQSSQHSIIIGTAGHIDHGKTSLVRALTGIDTDRLKEEKARGITIELGFARWQPNDDGVCCSFVDMPGHERFVRHMIAGAGGIDVVLLIVAADEGVMPQTREHLEICRLLGVEQGLVVLTKADLVDDEWLALVEDDTREFVSTTMGREWPMIHFSSKWPEQQLAGFAAELWSAIEQLPSVRRREQGLFRLPIDRVFTVHGFGTVVTGSVISGSIRNGDSARVFPPGLQCRIRRIQSHNETVDSVGAGTRAALNLQGIAADKLHRGAVVYNPPAVEPAKAFDVELHVLRGPGRAIKQRARLLLHIGTQHQLATVRLFQPQAEPGESTWARMILEEPLVTLPSDHFILRDFTHSRDYGKTIAGGRVLSIRPVRYRTTEKAKESMARLASGQAQVRLVEMVRLSRSRGRILDELALESGQRVAQIRKLFTRLERDQVLQLLELSGTARAFHRQTVDLLSDTILRKIGDFHRQHPSKTGLPRESLRTMLDDVEPGLVDSLAEQMQASGTLVQHEQFLALPEFFKQHEKKRSLPVYREIIECYNQAAATPPRASELCQRYKLKENDLSAMLSLMIRDGDLVRVSDDLHFSSAYLDGLQKRLVEFLEQNAEISTPQFKELTGASRRFTIPLGEYFDRSRVTIRIGDVRKLRG